jgi:hypothetical protein
LRAAAHSTEHETTNDDLPQDAVSRSPVLQAYMF